MKKEAFRDYLSTQIKKKPVSDCISRCVTVEYSLMVDLDAEYEKDKGEYVLSKVAYCKRDKDTDKPLPKEFSFKEGCNVVQRMTDLRSAVKRYFAYCGTET